MKKILLIVSLVFAANTMKAQVWADSLTNHVIGYIVNSKGKKTEGEMFVHRAWDVANYVNFAFPEIRHEGKETRSNTAKGGNVIEFGFSGYNFVYKRLPSLSKEFVFVVIEGVASYYESYIIENDNEKKIVEYVEVNNKLYPLSDIRFVQFKKGGAKVFADCKPVADKITNGEYTLNDMKAIVEEYNALMK